MNRITFEKARKFVYKNARPLDLARWQYHFENGSREVIIDALSVYQNEDGGFGHALEPDFWNPNSTPIATWAATERIKEIGLTDAKHPMIQGILRYLDSGTDFDTEHNQWMNVVPTNNDYPSSCWWKCPEDGGAFEYNPSATLAGFIIKYADKNSALYNKGVQITKEALTYLEHNVPFGEQHVTSCFVSLYQYCMDAEVDFIDMEKFRELLIKQVNFVICKEPEKWFTEYRPKPSEFIKSKDSIFLVGNEELVSKECELIISAQGEDGSYPVPWDWYTDYRNEFAISANWWKSDILINNMLFLQRFHA